MLLVEPAFLPLQPLPFSSDSVSNSFNPSPSLYSLNCDPRRLFLPFPIRPRTPVSRSSETQDLHLLRELRPVHARREVTIRPMKGTDVALVQRLQSKCLPLSYPPSFYTLLLTNSSSLCLLAFSPVSPSTLLGCVSGHILSYSHSSLSDDSESPSPPRELPIIYITSLAIDELARTQGIGYQLVQELIRQLLSSSSKSSGGTAIVHLHVEAKNEAAIRLYEKVGLKESRRIKGYYRGVRGGGDAIEMKGTVDA
ncbi:hypothetical protein JCM16303_005854 [Sporobolomyces ruberrimus]